MSQNYGKYVLAGLLYTSARSIYWLNKLECSSYDKNNKKIKHKVLLYDKIVTTGVNLCFSFSIWPVFIFSDIDAIQRKSMDLKVYPPFPYGIGFEFKDEE